jgi:hypothetical protein
MWVSSVAVDWKFCQQEWFVWSLTHRDAQNNARRGCLSKLVHLFGARKKIQIWIWRRQRIIVLDLSSSEFVVAECFKYWYLGFKQPHYQLLQIIVCASETRNYMLIYQTSCIFAYIARALLLHWGIASGKQGRRSARLNFQASSWNDCLIA